MSTPTPTSVAHRNLTRSAGHVVTKGPAYLAVVLTYVLLTAAAVRAQPSTPPATKAPPAAAAKQEKAPPAPLPAPGSLTFNTVITKLKAGKQVFCNTLTEPDLEAAKKACE